MSGRIAHDTHPNKRTFVSVHNLKKRNPPTITINNQNNISDQRMNGFSLSSTRGGSSQPDASQSSSALEKTFKTLTSFWATSGVVYILMKAVKRVLPIAMEPFQNGVGAPLTTFQLGAYIVTCLYFAYVEGYKGFQLKFAPLVVTRSFTIQPKLSSIHHTLFAPFYAMGLFHATKKRKIISWSVSIGVAGIVALVKKFPYPWRNIVDAGVVVGLSWGTLCIVAGYVKALLKGGVVEGFDPALPE